MRTLPLSAALLVFWIALSGTLTPGNLAAGAVLSGIVAVWAARFLWDEPPPTFSPRQVLRLATFLPVFLRTVVASAMQVAGMVLRPRMGVDPVVVSHRTRLQGETSRVVLANTLTLTPGTLTLDLEGDHLHVHCLTPDFGRVLGEGKLEGRIAHIFDARPR